MQALVDCPRPLAPWLTSRIAAAEPEASAGADRDDDAAATTAFASSAASTRPRWTGRPSSPPSTRARGARTASWSRSSTSTSSAGCGARARGPRRHGRRRATAVVADIYAAHPGEPRLARRAGRRLRRPLLAEVEFPRAVRADRARGRRARRGRGHVRGGPVHLPARRRRPPTEDESLRGLHPMMAERLRLWRFANFSLERLPSTEDVYLFRAIARDQPQGRAAVRDRRGPRPDPRARRGRPAPSRCRSSSRCCCGTLEAIRSFQVAPAAAAAAALEPRRALRLADARAEPGGGPLAGRAQRPHDGAARDRDGAALRPDARRRRASGGRGCCGSSARPGAGSWSRSATRPPTRCSRWTSPGQRLLAARRRGNLHPAEIVKLLAPAASDAEADQPSGEFVEHELDEDGRLVPVDRPPATNPTGHRRRA